MDKIKALELDLERTHSQIKNLETIHDNIIVYSLDITHEQLTNLYNNIPQLIKEPSQNAINTVISELAQFSGPSDKTHKFSTMRDEQRKFLLEKLKERYSEKKSYIDSLKQE